MFLVASGTPLHFKFMVFWSTLFIAENAALLLPVLPVHFLVLLFLYLSFLSFVSYFFKLLLAYSLPLLRPCYIACLICKQHEW